MKYCNDTMQAPDCGVCDCDGVLGTGIKSQPTPSQRTHPPTRGGNQINLDEKPSSRYFYVKGKVKRNSNDRGFFVGVDEGDGHINTIIVPSCSFDLII